MSETATREFLDPFKSITDIIANNTITKRRVKNSNKPPLIDALKTDPFINGSSGIFQTYNKDPFNETAVYDAHINSIKARIYEKNQNYLAIFTGATGSGKSYSCMGLALSFMPNLSIEHIVFSAKEFFALLNSGKLKKGDVIIWEELGTTAPSTDWYTKQNRAVKEILETFRTDNLIVFFNVPFIKFIDSKIRMLFHGHYKAKGYSVKQKIGYVKPYGVDYNDYQDKLYFPIPKVNIEGFYVKLDYLTIQKIPAKLANAYEKKRAEYLATIKAKHEKAINEDTKKWTTKGIIEDLKNKSPAELQEYTKSKILITYGVGINTAQNLSKMIREELCM